MSLPKTTKRYILTAVDAERKFACAGAYTAHTSKNTSDFLAKLIHVCPFPVTEIQTDNGSEFANHFERACEKHNITHYHTYPRSPKMNAFVERFNRTLSEDFIQWNKLLLRDNLHGFNEKLVDWLLWHNGERPHESLGMMPPLSYIVSTLQEKDCQMWWTRTPVYTRLNYLYNPYYFERDWKNIYRRFIKKKWGDCVCEWLGACSPRSREDDIFGYPRYFWHCARCHSA